MKFEDIKITLDGIEEIKENIALYANFNSACRLIKYWDGRMDQNIEGQLKKSTRLPYGFVGDGWPYKKDQDYTFDIGVDLIDAYEKEDINTRDVGDAVYQTHTILKHIEYRYVALNVVDIGSGYGRLAVPFFKAAEKDYKFNFCNYVGLDYSVPGLLIAPQFVSQMCSWVSVWKWDTFYCDLSLGADLFYSLPAWKISKVWNNRIDVFISIHSFQEMTKDTVEYYMELIDMHKGAIFYSINLENDKELVPSNWELVIDEPYPLKENRDGNFNQRLWRIK